MVGISERGTIRWRTFPIAAKMVMPFPPAAPYDIAECSEGGAGGREDASHGGHPGSDTFTNFQDKIWTLPQLGNRDSHLLAGMGEGSACLQPLPPVSVLMQGVEMLALLKMAA